MTVIRRGAEGRADALSRVREYLKLYPDATKRHCARCCNTTTVRLDEFIASGEIVMKKYKAGGKQHNWMGSTHSLGQLSK